MVQILKKRQDRKTNTNIQNSADMAYRLSLLFRLDHPQAVDIIMRDTSRTDIDKEMDVEFLNDQIEERKMIMGKQDEIYRRRYQKKVDKHQKEKERAIRWQQEKDAAAVKRKVDYHHHDNDEDDEVVDKDFVPPQTKQPKPQYVSKLLPRKILASA